MNLNVVVLLLAIQGLAHSFRKGQGDDLFGPWKEEDWGENSASSTAEYDDFTGFDSGSGAKGQRNEDEKPRTLPRIQRTFTNGRFVTSGDGEDKGGSKESGGSYSKFHGSNDQGSAKDSSIDLTKIADAFDIMKKLKKAKSDQELVNKLRSGPESLGVAFKTFEQLSGLWISVMHRIWRVWKAKGARVVMHSIVDDVMNNTGRAITQKVGDFFSKDNAVKPADGSGSATTINTGGSWEPETSHRSDVIQNKTVADITVEKVSVDFTKNATKAARAQPEKIQSSAKNVTDITEEVKVSFNDKNVNESISTQTTKQASSERKNYTQAARETTLDGMDKNLTVKSQKNLKSGSSTESTLKSATSLSKESEHPPEKIEIGNASFFNSGKRAKGLFNNERTLKVTRDFEENQHVTQHFTTNHVKKKQANVTQVLNHNQTKGSREINSDLKSKQTNTKVQNASVETQSTSVMLKVNTGSHHGNRNYLPSNKDVQLGKVVIIKEPKKANNTNQNQTKGSQEFNSDLSQETNTKVQNASSETHISSIRLNVNSDSHHGNGNHLSSNKDVHLQKVLIVKEPNKDNNTNHYQAKGGLEFNGDLIPKKTSTKVQNASSEMHTSSITLNVNTGSHHGNGNHLPSNKDVLLEKGLIIKEPNKDNNTNHHHQSKGTQEFNRDLISKETNTKVQNASSETHTSSIRLKVKSGSHHGNGDHLSSNKDVHLQKVLIIKEPNKDNNTGEKVRERENVKINFLEKSKRSHVEKKYNHVSQVDDLKSQTKSPVQIKSESKSDSKDTPTALSKQDQLALGANKRMRNINTARNSSKAKQDSYDKDEKQRFSNIRPQNSSMISSITSPNSKKIVVHLSDKEESSKDNETDSFVELKINGEDGNGDSRDNGSNDLSENDKVYEEKYGSKENGLSLSPRGTDKTERVDFEKTKIPEDEGYETQNDDEKSKKVADKDRVKNELQGKQIKRVFNDSGSGVAVISNVQKKLHARVEGSAHKLTQDYHQKSDTVKEQISIHTRKGMEIKYSPKGTGESQEESQKEKPERKVREGARRSAFQNNVKEARKTISHKSSLDTSASTSKTTSGLDYKTTRDPPKITLHISGKKQTNSLVESGKVARKERPKQPNIVRSIVTKDVADVEKHGQVIDEANSPVGSGQLQETDSDLKHEVQSDTSLTSESGSGLPLLEGGVTRNPKGHTEDDQKSGMTSDSKHELKSKQKGERINESENILKHNRNVYEEKSRPETALAQKPKGVVIVSPQRIVKHGPKSILDNSSKITKVTHQSSNQDHGSHRLKRKFSSQKLAKKPGQANLDETKHYNIARTAEENSGETAENGNIDEAKIKAQDASPGTDKKPNNLTKEDKEPNQVQHVDVLTSRTPPTSLLTTSNDDNTYSIKEIVQGPRGSRLRKYKNPDENRITSLRKTVNKLENEVTVLETAMADLAKRLLAVEQKSEHPFPTMPTLLHPPKAVTPHNPDAIHNQQQTTVYIDKDVTSTPKIPAPLYGPEKIVIPISSLYPGAEHVRTHPASIHEVHYEQEPKDNSRSGDKSRDTTHVTLPLGPQSGPTSEAHAEVRPIVNIIVPNRREDLLPTEAACVPRCQNGGLCLDGNSCRCPTFFTGDYCERFSLRDLLESPKFRERPYRKVQRVLLSELPDRQEMDGTARLDTRFPALEYRGFNLDRDIEPEKGFVVKQQPIEVASTSSSANTEGIARRRQLILEI